jgi:hypothetical protein
LTDSIVGGDAYAKLKPASLPAGGGEVGSFHFSSPLDLKRKEVTFMRRPSWEEPFEDREHVKKTLCTMGWAGHICCVLGAVFALLGIIGDAANATLGLEPTSWLLLAIFACVAGIPLWVIWGMSRHLLGTEAKSKKKE